MRRFATSAECALSVSDEHLFPGIQDLHRRLRPSLGSQVNFVSDRKGANESCGCHPNEDRAERNPGYRKALWLVASMNLGFGVAEMIGGFIANSQALKADALDFLGDGSITFVALLALAWTAAARAKVAFVQGVFLAGLGISVIAMAVWRALNAVPPEAELMGGIGVVALIINASAALILSRFREGDANVKAIWLFSRNDALANVAVIVAALLVAWTDRAWPDVIVAVCIAALFMHSSIEIIRSARTELPRRY